MKESTGQTEGLKAGYFANLLPTMLGARLTLVLWPGDGGCRGRRQPCREWRIPCAGASFDFNPNPSPGDNSLDIQPEFSMFTEEGRQYKYRCSPGLRASWQRRPRTPRQSSKWARLTLPLRNLSAPCTCSPACRRAPPCHHAFYHLRAAKAALSPKALASSSTGICDLPNTWPRASRNVPSMIEQDSSAAVSFTRRAERPCRRWEAFAV